MEPKLNIFPKGEATTILLGKDVQVLEDHSKWTFKTTDPQAFTTYCLNHGTENKHVLFSTSLIVLVTDTLDRYTEPDAVCSVSPSQYVRLFERAINNGAMSLASTEEFLFTLRPFISDEGRALYSYVRNFKASKLTSITRSLDRQGNYNYLVTRANGGSEGEFIPPEQLTFEIPVVNALSIDVKEAFTTDLFFDWKDTSEGCIATFTLKCPLFEAMKEQAIQSTLSKHLSPLECPKFWGKVELSEKDNKWQHLFNGTEK